MAFRVHRRWIHLQQLPTDLHSLKIQSQNWIQSGHQWRFQWVIYSSSEGFKSLICRRQQWECDCWWIRITVALIKFKKLISFGKLTCKGGVVAHSPTFVIVKVTTVNCSLATDCLINVGFALQDWNWRLIGYWYCQSWIKCNFIDKKLYPDYSPN